MKPTGSLSYAPEVLLRERPASPAAARPTFSPRHPDILPHSAAPVIDDEIDLLRDFGVSDAAIERLMEAEIDERYDPPRLSV